MSKGTKPNSGTRDSAAEIVLEREDTSDPVPTCYPQVALQAETHTTP